MRVQPPTNTHTVSAIAVIDLANELLSLKAINASFFSRLGHQFQANYEAWKSGTSIQEARLPEHLMVDLWNEASRARRDDPLGLLIGLKVNPKSKGILANWLSQSDTLEEAFAIFSDNIHLLNPSENWQMERYDDRITLTLSFRSPDYPPEAIDRSMAAIVAWGSMMAGKRILPLHASFRCAAPRQLKKYIEVFGDDLRFSHPTDSLCFSLETFSQPTKGANRYLKGLLEKRAAELSENIRQTKKSYTREVRSLLAEDMPRYCQIEAACKALNVSRSTLFRKLKSEETNFTQLLIDARLARAQHFEKMGTDHTSIAEVLGFKDGGSYYRFRKAYASLSKPHDPDA